MTRVRLLQLLGIAVVGASAFFPTLQLERLPWLQASATMHYEISAGSFVRDGRQIPVRELRKAFARSLQGPARLEPLWKKRAWYPFVLVPLWLLALLVTRAGAAAYGRPGNRVVGLALLGIALGIALFEAVYLHADYASFLPGALGTAEVVAVWLLVVGVLFWRRRPDRHLGAVGAAVGAQALLGFLHMLTLPATMARPWIGNFPLSRVVAAVSTHFPPAFWVASGGLLLIAAPVYLRPARAEPRKQAG